MISPNPSDEDQLQISAKIITCFWEQPCIDVLNIFSMVVHIIVAIFRCVCLIQLLDIDDYSS